MPKKAAPQPWLTKFFYSQTEFVGAKFGEQKWGGGMLKALSMPLFFHGSSIIRTSTPTPPQVWACPRSKLVALALSVRIVVVGDVHDDWDPLQDAKALHSLKPDLVLFTGMYLL